MRVTARMIRMRRGDDLHAHLRQDDLLNAVAPHSARQFARVLPMGNTKPAIVTAEDVNRYRSKILKDGGGVEPIMTIKLVPRTTPAIIKEAKRAGAYAGKLYPVGVTTNADDGVADMDAMYPVFEAMQDANMVLCLHGEKPGAPILQREKAFLPTLCEIVDAFPRLRVVLEHITTADAVFMVSRMPPTVAATITVHHLYLTHDDIFAGSKLRPHAFCLPIAKSSEDRASLILAATSGDPRFFLGTDSAPHLRGTKECDGGCAGVFSAPVAMQALAAVFESRGKLDRLEDFCSRFGAEFYGLPLNEGKLELRRDPWVVPAMIDGIVPFMAGQTLDWRLA